MKKREYLRSVDGVEFGFFQTPDDFRVDEIASREFKGRGNYLILKVEKTELTTWDMVAVFCEYLGIEAKKIGYAGLKDKHATTTQYISVEGSYERMLKKFYHRQIRILSMTRDSHSIRMGDLEANRFSINLYDVDNIDAGKIEKVARKLSKEGVLNYFGYQRFGRDENSIEQAKEMIEGDLFVDDAKVKNFLTSVYQSAYFNDWLVERVELTKKHNKTVLMPLEGDVFTKGKNRVVTGLLCGRDVKRAKLAAREIEKKYDDEYLQSKGYRREALVFPKDIECSYVKKYTMLKISFTLPKGAYATIFLENIANKNYTAKDVKRK